MDVFECIANRRSIRKYKAIPVEWEHIGRIIEAGMAAPSAGNLQDTKFIVVLDEGKRKAIAEACMKQLWMAAAPVHIVICSDPQKTRTFYGVRGERLYTIQNAAAAAENMLLAAHALNLGACWVGAFSEDMIRDCLSIPNYARPQLVITIGYADEKAILPPKLRIEHCVFINRYWGKYWNPETEVLKETHPHIQKAIAKTKEKLSSLKNISIKKPGSGDSKEKPKEEDNNNKENRFLNKIKEHAKKILK